MNQDKETTDSGIADENVSAAYRAVAVESAPVRLDAEVLRRAALEGGRNGKTLAQRTWLRPAVFVATAGLSLAIVLEVSDVGIFETGQQPGAASDSAYPPRVGGSDRAEQALPHPAAQPGREAADTAAPGPVFRDAKESAASASDAVTADPQRDAPISSQSGSGSASRQQPARAAQNVTVDAEPAASAGSAGRATGLAVSSVLPGADFANRQAPGEVSVTAKADDSTEQVIRFCNEEQVQSPDTWWQCIEALSESGQAEAARLESELLLVAYPDFQPAR